MKLKRKLIVLIFLVVLVAVSVYILPGYLPAYDKYLFYPLQSFRIILFGWVPFSLGDVLYVLGGAMLLLTIINWVYFIVKFGKYKTQLAASVLNTINAALFIYLYFILGWGANYAKPPLREYWKLATPVEQDHAARRKADSLALIAFNQFLVDRINTCAPHYHTLSFHEINERSKSYYRLYTDSKVRMHGLDVKYSLFGYFMERIAIDGYYNPFTGEGQITGSLPAFILPFVVCHEMAHQAGIAAEGDANLMAYALGTATNDTSFNYSCYLNIWLYANSRLYRRDSVSAKQFEGSLNALTKAHLDTLEQLAKKYNNEVSRYSSELYDGYLKMQKQKEGIRSYGNVSSSAWQLELQRKNGKGGIISIP